MHIRDEELEQFAMGTLPPSALQDLELHLLVCHRCQDRIAEMDAVVAALRAACEELNSKENRCRRSNT